MAKQTIGIGATDDDGTGDQARAAFDKINDNFTELYVQRAATPFDYGAAGNGVANDTTAVQSAVDTGACYLPEGYTFNVHSPIQVPAGGSLIGAGRNSTLNGVSVSGGIVQFGDGGANQAGATLKNFRITGAGTYGVRLNNASECELDNIWVWFTGTDGFKFDTTFGCKLGMLSTTTGSISNACFNMGASFNINRCGPWYTNNTDVPFNFLLDGGSSDTGSGGNVFDGLCAQGGQIGLAALTGGGNVFNGFWSEDVVKPVVIGDTAGSKHVRGMTFNGGQFGGPATNHPHYSSRIACIDFNNCIGVTFNNPYFVGAYLVGDRAAVAVTGAGGGSGAVVAAYVTAGGVVSSLKILQGGASYSGAITVTITGAGSGATATGTESGGVINGVTLTNGGSGYTGVGMPVATFYTAFKCKINNPVLESGLVGNVYTEAAWPWIVKNSSAVNTSGIEVEGDIALDPVGWYSAAARLIRADVTGHQHYVKWYNTSGTEQSASFVPATFP